MRNSQVLSQLLGHARKMAEDAGVKYLTPEHVLLASKNLDVVRQAAKITKLDLETMMNAIESYVEDIEPGDYVSESFYFKKSLEVARAIATDRKSSSILFTDFLCALISLQIESVLLIEQLGVRSIDFLNTIHLLEMTAATGKVHINHISGNSTSQKQSENPDPANTNEYLKDLCLAAKNNPEPLIGRDLEILRTIEILGRAKKNNPIHIGEPGVGKTAIAKGIAAKINEGDVPDRFKSAKIFSLDLGSLISGTKFRGEFEERLKGVLNQLKDIEGSILYIDEIHNIVGLGSGSESSFDGANILKDYLTDSSIKFIGATTNEEYKKHFQKDKALSRRFQPVNIKEPSIDETIEILKGLKSFYEDFHGVKYSKNAIESAVYLSHKYIQDRFLPDKAIDLIDEAGAKISMSRTKKAKNITKTHIEDIIATLCKIPKETMETSEASKLIDLSSNIKNRVYGQDQAIETLVDNIKLSRAGLSAERKPVASVLFVGPTGVGKTEVGRSLADELGVKLIKFDMSEYAEEHSISKLIGAPAGYVGYEEGGLLVEIIKQNPHCVLLLDEIEKAHPKIFNVLLQVMDDATLSDNQGRKADFRNVVLIMTSNAGAASVGKRLVGFGDKSVPKSNILEVVGQTFAPEFRNRLTDIVTFNAMSEDMGQLIVKKELNILSTLLKDKQVEADYTEDTINYILKKGISTEYGARQIQRVVSGEIKKLFVDELLFGQLTKGGKCIVKIEENTPVIEIV